MTVRRQGEASFNVDKSRLVAYTRIILAANSIYKDTKRSGDDSFATTVQSGSYLLRTPMTISFEEAGAVTTVKVSITSQAFLIGDKFGYYDRYIHDFLDELKRAVP